ncbi:MAG: serine--tRNA ligase [Peptococcaceae bacterium]|nr:serine--tRNA ligase [Peptococcaceae bacterium]
MLDIKFIRENQQIVEEALAKRGGKVSLDGFLKLEQERRALLTEVEQMKATRNAASKEIGILKQQGKDASEQMEATRKLGDEIAAKDQVLAEIDAKIQSEILTIPNIPQGCVPVGTSEDDNVEIRKWGTPRDFDFDFKAHWDIGEDLDILDFARGAKLTGARFTLYKGLGARLERAVTNFFLDTHTQEDGYTEMFTPFIANSASMIGTGQLPKFSEDMFKLEGLDYYLIPTAEVTVTNMYRDEILSADQLPLSHTAYSACFRAEAGSAGRDTRGIIRQHQFNKVEMVKFTKPEESDEELEKLTGHAEKVLQLLGLPYRVIILCTGDLGFSSSKTYDLEVWLPSYNAYKEISSCSNFVDFQARRANIRFRRDANSKPEFVHTLNGSGLAVGRTVAAILENYQQADGSVKIPDVLVPYMGGVTEIPAIQK